MQPLSPRKRRTYLYVLIALFFLALPASIFYAQGYRFSGEEGFLKTGGIFLSVPYAGAVVSLNDEVVGESSLLRRSFYIGNLESGTYTVDVQRDEDHPWRRTLVVEPEVVTDADALLIPMSVELVELTSAKNAATTTRRISQQELSEYLTEFREETATTTTDGVGTLALEGGKLFLRWQEKESVAPSIYCKAPSSCVQEIAISAREQNVTNAAFFGGGIVYSTESGLYIREADVRPTTFIMPLYSKPHAAFRVIDGHLIVKDGERLYEILGL